MPERRMPLEQFRADGYLQEVNRRFFHPLGLALEATRVASGRNGKRITFGDDGIKALTWIIDRAVEEGITTDDYVSALRQSIEEGEVVEAGEVWLSGVTITDDPEGIVSTEHEQRISKDSETVLSSPDERHRKRTNIDCIWAAHKAAREAALGYMVQEIG